MSEYSEKYYLNGAVYFYIGTRYFFLESSQNILKRKEIDMQTSTELRSLLNRIDHRGYPAYKDTKGMYQFRDMCCPSIMYRGILSRRLLK